MFLPFFPIFVFVVLIYFVNTYENVLSHFIYSWVFRVEYLDGFLFSIRKKCAFWTFLAPWRVESNFLQTFRLFLISPVRLEQPEQ